MDWELAIQKNRAALLAIAAALVVMAGLARGPALILKCASPSPHPEVRAQRASKGGGMGYGPQRATVTELPRSMRLAILRILRPAESALRRLIVIIAARRGLCPSLSTGTAAARPLPDFARFAGNAKTRTPGFRLTDPRKRFTRTVATRAVPRIRVPGHTDPIPRQTPGPTQAQAAEVDAAATFRRLAAFHHALRTLPRQARRLARHLARRAGRPPASRNPLRPGRPPGFHRRPRHPIDAVLVECDRLARDCAWPPP